MTQGYRFALRGATLPRHHDLSPGRTVVGQLGRPIAASRPLEAGPAQARAAFEASAPLVTQNIDGLHQRAGSRNVIELHGSVFRTKCNRPECGLEPYQDDEDHVANVPTCPMCGATLRPDVVLFDEPIPGAVESHVKRALRDCDMFLAVGTSGTVAPASNFVRSAEYEKARTVLVNLEPMKPRHPAVDEEYLGRAEEILPILLS